MRASTAEVGNVPDAVWQAALDMPAAPGPVRRRRPAALRLRDVIGPARHISGRAGQRLEGHDPLAGWRHHEHDQMGMTGYGSSINAGAGQDMGLVPIAGGKHFTPEDHPDRIAAAINDLLNFRENR